MKYILVGLHASGKQEVLDKLKEYGCSVGKLFSNLEQEDKSVYNSKNYEYYNVAEINEIFENKAYLFVQELQCPEHFEACKYFEGLSKFEFESNTFFAISPDQLLAMQPSNLINEPVCFVWMDCSKSIRMNRYRTEKRCYDFQARENIEKLYINEFVKFLYSFNNAPVLYFDNEVPDRIATILMSLDKHPDLLPDFIKNFD